MTRPLHLALLFAIPRTPARFCTHHAHSLVRFLSFCLNVIELFLLLLLLLSDTIVLATRLRYFVSHLLLICGLSFLVFFLPTSSPSCLLPATRQPASLSTTSFLYLSF